LIVIKIDIVILGDCGGCLLAYPLLNS